MRVTFLIPTLNEAEGIRATLNHIPRRELESMGFDVDAVVVDGASGDGTADVAKSLGARVVVEPRPGYGRAYKTGLKSVDGDYIVTGDADGTYPFERVPAYLEEMRREGFDFVTLNRYADLERGAMSLMHRVGNWVLSAATRILFRIKLRDSQSGMWILTRQAVDRLPLDRLSDSMAFSQELKVEAFLNGRVAAGELPGALRPRIGQPKLNSWRDGVGNLMRLNRHRRFRRTWANGQG